MQSFSFDWFCQGSVDLVDDRIFFGEVGDLSQVALKEITVEEYAFTVFTILEFGIGDKVADAALLAVAPELVYVSAAA